MRWPLPIVAASLALLGAPASAGAQAEGPLDCEGAAPDPQPSTAQWFARDANNILCARQRHLDKPAHPVSPLPLSTSIQGIAPLPLADAYREPSRHDGERFRFAEATITNRDGDDLAAEVYRPCAPGSCERMPAALRALEPPYPAVVIVHGGGSRKELHWWSSQTLAESGYLVVAFDVAAEHHADAEDVLDWLFATPRRPTAAGEHNPFWRQLDRRRVGIAGHSAGGVAASRLGQADPRLSALVSWDRAQSSPMPAGLELRHPAMFQFADYNCQRVPICEPEPYPAPPDPDGPGNKGEDFERVRAAGIDTMQVGIRAATHLDWVPSEPAGSRYAEAVSTYYTLAWFDRYLRGAGRPRVAGDAFARLTATRFDDSADRHNISQGIFDPVAAAASPADPYAGNVPYRIEGMPVANRLSFYFRSKCFLSPPPGEPGRRVSSEDIRADRCSGRLRG